MPSAAPIRSASLVSTQQPDKIVVRYAYTIYPYSLDRDAQKSFRKNSDSPDEFFTLLHSLGR